MICCFFGHREVRKDLTNCVERIIEEQIALGVELFLVGNQGDFDRLVLHILRKVEQRNPHIQHRIVLAYLPKRGGQTLASAETVFPEGQELIHPRYVIPHRNRYMVDQSDCVIAYITHSWGGAAAAVAYAERKGKKIIRII